MPIVLTVGVGSWKIAKTWAPLALMRVICEAALVAVASIASWATTFSKSASRLACAWWSVLPCLRQAP